MSRPTNEQLLSYHIVQKIATELHDVTYSAWKHRLPGFEEADNGVTVLLSARTYSVVYEFAFMSITSRQSARRSIRRSRIGPPCSWAANLAAIEFYAPL